MGDYFLRKRDLLTRLGVRGITFRRSQSDTVETPKKIVG